MEKLDHNPNPDDQIVFLGTELATPMETPTASVPEDAKLPAEVEIMAQPESAGSIPAIPGEGTLSLSWMERFWKLALILILLLAVALRTRGLNWDEGQHIHPDERFLTMVETAIQIPSSLGQYFDTSQSPLNPYNNNFGSFVYGTAPLFFVRLVGQITGLTDYESMVLLGRALSALADLFVTAMTFFIARRLYGLRIGLLAALFYALSVLPIKQSHYFTVDTFTNVPVMLAFWFTLDIMEGKRGMWAFILAGGSFGLMLASRINMAPFIGIIAIASLLQLIKVLEGFRQMTVEVKGLDVKKTFESPVSAIPDSSTSIETLPAHRIQVGPLLIEIEFKPQADSESKQEDASTNRESAQRILLGPLLAVIAAVLVFRITQPYAFDGLFSLNPQYVEDMSKAQRVISGQDDYPPGHQWTNRTPFWFPWYNLVVWGFGPALGLTAWLGVALAAFQVWRQQRWEHLLMLLWVAGMFLYHGQQFVKTMRYYMPLYPFLAIFAALFLFAVWNGAKDFDKHGRNLRLARSSVFFAGLLFTIVISTTVFLAIAHTSIYTRTNTRVAASRWIYSNIADGKLIGSEHWDDVLPLRVDGKDYYRDHEGVMLELYGEDTPEKRDKMVEWMDQVDYIILSSNRLYGSIPRLPMRFPLTTKYYQWLFNGELGFAPVKEFTSYPQFLGVTIIDDNAEEAFTVYDHPKVVIFQKTSAYSHDKTVKLFNSVDLTEVLRLKPIDAAASRRQFRMTPVDLAANRAGGTWSDLFHPNDLANRVPVLIWLLTVWGIGVLTFPFTFVLFRSFADRGYAFAKTLGVLFVAWFAWTLSSYHILPFGRIPVLIGIVSMAVFGLLLGRKYWQELRTYIKTSLTTLLIVELVFFVFFAIDLAIRFQNPDLWHPWMGGERPMDVAFLNAIVKTTYFPPYNPWFAGNTINYYYFGQLISAALVHLTGILPEVAYNLLIPIFFALTASGVFGVVFNLVWSGRQRSQSEAPVHDGGTNSSNILLPGLAGIFGVILVLIIGNLGEIKLAVKGLTELGGGRGVSALMNGLNKWLLDGETIPVRIGDWYWTATRVIPSTINEFPFFTFIYGDLHAHLIAIPYALTALGLAAHLLLSHDRLRWYDLGVIALLLGTLRAINTWDYPTYLGIIGAAIIFKWNFEPGENNDLQTFSWQDWLQQWLRFLVLLFFQIVLILVPMDILGIRLTMELVVYIVLLCFGIVLGLKRLGKAWKPVSLLHTFSWQFLPLILLSILLFLPYVLNYATGYASFEIWKDARTTWTEYLTVHGIFLFIITTFFIMLILTSRPADNPSKESGVEFAGWEVYLIPLLIIGVIALTLMKLPIVALVLLLVSFGAWLGIERETSLETRWVSILMCVGLVLTLLVEYVVLKGDVGRMNTVFKFYLQAWTIFGVAGAAGLGLIINQLALTRRAAIRAETEMSPVGEADTLFATSASSNLRWLWWGAFSLLILAGLVYPVAAARAKMNDRYVAGSPPGLNGMDYMQQGATYNENNQELDLRWDYEAIQWMRQNIKGSPVIMEGNTGLYRWGNRYSIYTGLPTIIGWDWHTKQQYSLIPGDIVDYRIGLVREFYNTLDETRAMDIAKRYDISYIVVGGLERAVYDPNGLNKFEAMAQQGNLVKVYDSNQVQIYQVLTAELMRLTPGN